MPQTQARKYKKRERFDPCTCACAYAYDVIKDVFTVKLIKVIVFTLILASLMKTRLEGTDKRGHIVADTLMLMIFLGLRKLGNISCGHNMFLNKLRNVFCAPDTKFVSATNVARGGKRGNICVGNNVSSFASTLRIRRD